jgi:hypothetical protein
MKRQQEEEIPGCSVFYSNFGTLRVKEDGRALSFALTQETQARPYSQEILECIGAFAMAFNTGMGSDATSDSFGGDETDRPYPSFGNEPSTSRTNDRAGSFRVASPYH